MPLDRTGDDIVAGQHHKYSEVWQEVKTILRTMLQDHEDIE